MRLEIENLTILPNSRWLRLLFTREFSMADAMKLWDGLFACDASLDLAQWVCVAMLIRIRNECKKSLRYTLAFLLLIVV